MPTMSGIDPDREGLEHASLSLANKVENQAVDKETVVDCDVEQVTEFTFVDIAVGNIENEGNEVVEDNHGRSRDECRPQNVTMYDGESCIQVLCQEQQPEERAEHVGQVQECVAPVDDDSRHGARLSVGGVGDGVENASAKSEKEDQLQESVFRPLLAESPYITCQQDTDENDAEYVTHINSCQFKSAFHNQSLP